MKKKKTIDLVAVIKLKLNQTQNFSLESDVEKELWKGGKTSVKTMCVCNECLTWLWLNSLVLLFSYRIQNPESRWC